MVGAAFTQWTDTDPATNPSANPSADPAGDPSSIPDTPIFGSYTARPVRVSNIIGNPDDGVAYTVTVANGAMSVHAGVSPHADVTIHSDHPTALRLARRELAVVDAIEQGLVEIDGNLPFVLAQSESLSAFEQTFAPLRSAVAYPQGLD